MNEDEKVIVAALAYYLYRLTGCPFGDSPNGLHAWIQVQIQAFEKISKGE